MLRKRFFLQGIYFLHRNYEKLSIEKWFELKTRKYYLAYYPDYERLDIGEVSLDENSDEYKIIYKDEYGFILERIENN